MTDLSRNPGTPLSLKAATRVRVNRSAAEHRAKTLLGRRSLKRRWQAAWLLLGVKTLDLTTLAGDDTPARVRRLCAKARKPIRSDLLHGMGVDPETVRAGAVCVYHRMVPAAVKALEGSGIPVAAVSTGFPAGLSPLPTRLEEIRRSAEAGADEIDVVITRGLALQGRWEELYDEVRAFRTAAGAARIKVILGVGELGTLSRVAQASAVAMMAGADFVKTSTGKERINATLPAGLAMARAIRAFRRRTGHLVGLKPAGGLSSSRDLLSWLILVREELGPEWLDPRLLRFGASSLLGDIERQIEHFVTGRYSALRRHPLA